MDALELLVRGTVVIFVVSSMIAIGLAAPGAEIIAPLRRPVWVLRGLGANFVLAPAAALAITALLPIDSEFKLGLLILGFAAGSPLLPKLAEAGRTDVPSATALMVLLMAGSVFVMPLALPLAVRGLQVTPLRIAAPLVVLMLVPLLLAMAGRRFAPRASAAILPPFKTTSNIAFVAVVILICGTNVNALVGVLGSGAIAAALLFVGVLFAGGRALADPDTAARRLLGYATAGRNIGAALVVAGASAADPQAVVMLIVTGVVGLVFLLFATVWFRRGDGGG